MNASIQITVFIENVQARNISLWVVIYLICSQMQFIQIISHVPHYSSEWFLVVLLLNRAQIQKSRRRKKKKTTENRRIICPPCFLFSSSSCATKIIQIVIWNSSFANTKYKYTPFNWLSIFRDWARQWNRKHCHLFWKMKNKKEKKNDTHTKTQPVKRKTKPMKPRTLHKFQLNYLLLCVIFLLSKNKNKKRVDRDECIWLCVSVYNQNSRWIFFITFTTLQTKRLNFRILIETFFPSIVFCAMSVLLMMSTGFVFLLPEKKEKKKKIWRNQLPTFSKVDWH